MARLFVVGTTCLLFGALLMSRFSTDNGPWQWPEVARAQPPSVGFDTSLRTARVRPSTSGEPILTPEEQANIRVYEVANRSVVNINTSTIQYDRFFMLARQGEGSGSGSVIDKQGHVLTNYHVVEDAREIEVTLFNGNAYSAELIGHDKETDIAVLRISAPSEELFPIALGSSDNLRVGQRAYALGNPFGLEGTLTTGIVSSLNRTLPSRVGDRKMKSMIQTDAAMNPGNSGGPLLDTSATMVGMNVAIATKTGQNAGVGFAIPVNRIRRVVPELIQYGKIVRADHGIVAVMPTERGLKIVKLNRGGPAEDAGLRGYRILRRQVRRGTYAETIDRSYSDYILAINGTQISTPAEFLDLMDQFKPGDVVTFTVFREGARLDVPVRLGAE